MINAVCVAATSMNIKLMCTRAPGAPAAAVIAELRCYCYCINTQS